MSRSYFSKRHNKWVSEFDKNDTYAIAFDANTNEPIYEGDMVYGERFSHGEWKSIEFMCFEYIETTWKHRYCKRVVANKYSCDIIKGIPYHDLRQSQTIRYFKIK